MPEKNQINWVPIPDDESVELYFYWRVPIGMINIMNAATGNSRNVHMSNDKAIISYQTTALVLPEDELAEVVMDLNDMFNLNCSVSL